MQWKSVAESPSTDKAVRTCYHRRHLSHGSHVMKHFSTLCTAICLSLSSAVAAAAPTVLMTTSLGEITLELDAERAPNTVENFLAYVADGSYDGTVFHRVINGFMIQGGGFDKGYERRETRPPIENEADNGLKNERGTIAMARTQDPHSATNQFFINVVDNAFLDYQDSTTAGWGYTVFGRVVDGMDVVDKIREVATGPAGPFRKDAPAPPVVIESVQLLKISQ